MAGPDPTELKARLMRLGGVAKQVLGRQPKHVTAPGGFDRDSLRLHFDTGTAIVTERASSHAADLEARILQALHPAGAAVPRLLGRQGHVLLQEDLPGVRLSEALMRAQGQEQRDLALRAMRSLWSLKAVAQRADMLAGLPPLALGRDWVADFARGPQDLSEVLNLAVPELNHDRIEKRLSLRPQHFIKWDARAGNAVVQPDGRIAWFDWEVTGRRGGIEDLAILTADEAWPLSAEMSFDVFLAASPPMSEVVQHAFLLFAVFQSAARLRILNERIAQYGWMKAATALQLDQAGTAPELVRGLAARGQALADMLHLTRPLVPWFPEVAEAIIKQNSP